MTVKRNVIHKYFNTLRKELITFCQGCKALMGIIWVWPPNPNVPHEKAGNNLTVMFS